MKAELGNIKQAAIVDNTVRYSRTTAPVLLADYVTTGNGLKNGIHCGL